MAESEDLAKPVLPVDKPLPAALRYPGAKWTLAPLIIRQFRPHYHYIEPFFGSGAVFFSKPPVPHEVINDQSSDVTNLFRVLRDDTDALCSSLAMTPWARDEFDACHLPTEDPVEAARRFVVRCWQGHASDLSKITGWKNRGPSQRAAGMSHRWAKVPEQLRWMGTRLLQAEIENRPAIEVIERHAAADCLIYADPPYPHGVRTQAMYQHEMDDHEHALLLDSLLAHPGPVVVSGYANEMYDTALAGWRRVVTKAPKSEKASVRLEVLWVKP